MKLTKLDKLDFTNKSFVFDSSLSFFRCGGEWISREEYFNRDFPHSDGYLSEFDKENPIVMKVAEAGGYVRKAISGKTDYYVVGKSQNDSPAKNRDYQQQLANERSQALAKSSGFRRVPYRDGLSRIIILLRRKTIVHGQTTDELSVKH